MSVFKKQDWREDTRETIGIFENELVRLHKLLSNMRPDESFLDFSQGQIWDRIQTIENHVLTLSKKMADMEY